MTDQQPSRTRVSKPSLCLLKDGEVIIPRVAVADRAGSRMVGLLGRAGLPAGEAVWLNPATSIHTAFMRFSLDVVFLTPDRRIRRIVRELRPWRLAFGGGWRGSCLEFQSGWLPDRALSAGDVVELRPNR
jgi:uncharacterized membrane protein (UPF0127 family)